MEWVIRSTSCLVQGCGFRGQRIEWRYFQFDQIQVGGWAAICRLLGKFKWRYLRDRSSDLHRLVLGWGFWGRRIE